MEEEELISNGSDESSSSSAYPLPADDGDSQAGQSDEVYAVEVVNWSDYSVALGNIQQVQVYQSGMLLALCVVVVIFMGLVGGMQLTKWWRARQ